MVELRSRVRYAKTQIGMRMIDCLVRCRLTPYLAGVAYFADSQRQSGAAVLNITCGYIMASCSLVGSIMEAFQKHICRASLLQVHVFSGLCQLKPCAKNCESGEKFTWSEPWYLVPAK